MQVGGCLFLAKNRASVGYFTFSQAAHAAELRNQLERYVAHGRRLPGGSARRSSKPAAAGREENQKIRQRAQNSGFNPSSRGAISRHIKQPYDAAQG
jgi:hypothetical protein